MLKFQVILLILALFKTISAEGIKCEKIGVEYWDEDLGSMKTCVMTETTSITTAETKIDEPKDEAVVGIRFWGNREIKFLPIEIHEIFPNLRVLDASSCSLTTVSKKDFEKLNNLEHLYLHDNQIEKIPTNAFEGLNSLKELTLFNNKIKFLKGQAFDGLSKLNTVKLDGNECIEKDFEGAEEIATLKSVVEEKCGFQE